MKFRFAWGAVLAGGYQQPNLHRSNDTGLWRGSDDLHQLPSEIDTGGTPACEIGCGHCPQGSLVKGSWHGVAVTEGFTAGTFRKYRPMWKPASLSSSRLGGAEAPPFGKGGFGLRFYFHPVTLPGTGGAVTIRRRLPCALSAETRRRYRAGQGSNDYRPAWCEIVCGHCLPGGFPAVWSRFHFLTLLLYTILSKKASRKIPT